MTDNRRDNRTSPDADAQEQAVDRSPRNPDDSTGVTTEHTATSNTQSSSGLAGGSPRGGPMRTPERTSVEPESRVRSGRDADHEEEPEPVLPTDDSTLNTKI